MCSVLHGKLMNEVVQGLQWSICVCYMDDTLVWAQNFEEMMERLELVLERFIRANLSLKAMKHLWLAPQVPPGKHSSPKQRSC